MLASAELPERDLACGSRSESEAVVTVGVSEESQSPCRCQVFPTTRPWLSALLAKLLVSISLLGGFLFWVGDVQLRVSEERRVTCHPLDCCLVEMDESLNHAEVSAVRIRVGRSLEEWSFELAHVSVLTCIPLHRNVSETGMCLTMAC